MTCIASRLGWEWSDHTRPQRGEGRWEAVSALSSRPFCPCEGRPGKPVVISRRVQVHIWTRPRCQGGCKLKKHASGQMQPYIRPLGEDRLWSSGPDELCASSPYHDRGLTGPVPEQG